MKKIIFILVDNLTDFTFDLFFIEKHLVLKLLSLGWNE